jgi:hypothetical protein
MTDYCRSLICYVCIHTQSRQGLKQDIVSSSPEPSKEVKNDPVEGRTSPSEQV